ncbi:hypothetical protein [Nonomuraea sp. NPDC050310]|uniref:hypothetical protein n=1 Tax=Nonomuraea sp. NPDC050310 TaxID=3154935 RepID=UPI0033EB6A7B
MDHDEPPAPRRALLAVAVAAVVAVGLLGATHPALWPDGRACAGFFRAVMPAEVAQPSSQPSRAPLAVPTAPEDLFGEPLELDVELEDLDRLIEEMEQRKSAEDRRRRREVLAVAAQADSPELRAALEQAAGPAPADWLAGMEKVGTLCG